MPVVSFVVGQARLPFTADIPENASRNTPIKIYDRNNRLVSATLSYSQFLTGGRGMTPGSLEYSTFQAIAPYFESGLNAEQALQKRDWEESQKPDTKSLSGGFAPQPQYTYTTTFLPANAVQSSLVNGNIVYKDQYGNIVGAYNPQTQQSIPVKVMQTSQAFAQQIQAQQEFQQRHGEYYGGAPSAQITGQGAMGATQIPGYGQPAYLAEGLQTQEAAQQFLSTRQYQLPMPVQTGLSKVWGGLGFVASAPSYAGGEALVQTTEKLYGPVTGLFYSPKEKERLGAWLVPTQKEVERTREVGATLGEAAPYFVSMGAVAPIYAGLKFVTKPSLETVAMEFRTAGVFKLVSIGSKAIKIGLMAKRAEKAAELYGKGESALLKFGVPSTTGLFFAPSVLEYRGAMFAGETERASMIRKKTSSEMAYFIIGAGAGRKAFGKLFEPIESPLIRKENILGAVKEGTLPSLKKGLELYEATKTTEKIGEPKEVSFKEAESFEDLTFKEAKIFQKAAAKVGVEVGGSFAMRTGVSKEIRTEIGKAGDIDAYVKDIVPGFHETSAYSIKRAAKKIVSEAKAKGLQGVEYKFIPDVADVRASIWYKGKPRMGLHGEALRTWTLGLVREPLQPAGTLINKTPSGLKVFEPRAALQLKAHVAREKDIPVVKTVLFAGKEESAIPILKPEKAIGLATIKTTMQPKETKYAMPSKPIKIISKYEMGAKPGIVFYPKEKGYGYAVLKTGTYAYTKKPTGAYAKAGEYTVPTTYAKPTEGYLPPSKYETPTYKTPSYKTPSYKVPEAPYKFVPYEKPTPYKYHATTPYKYPTPTTYGYPKTTPYKYPRPYKGSPTKTPPTIPIKIAPSVSELKTKTEGFVGITKKGGKTFALPQTTSQYYGEAAAKSAQQIKNTLRASFRVVSEASAIGLPRLVQAPRSAVQPSRQEFYLSRKGFYVQKKTKPTGSRLGTFGEISEIQATRKKKLRI